MDIIIFGAQGLGKDTFSLIEDTDADHIIGFIDEINFDRELFGLPVRKTLNEFGHDAKLIIAVGDPKGKKEVKVRLDKLDVEYTNIIHKNILYSSELVDVGIGNIIMGNVSFTGNVNIGNHICIYSQTAISHDCDIGNYSTICPGVTICGNVTIGEGCFIGAGTVIKEKVNIADNVFIGAGSLVLRDIVEAGLYYGHPIKVRKVTGAVE